MGGFMCPASSSFLTLASGSLELQLAPPFGGSIARFDYLTNIGKKIPCLRGVEGNGASPLDHGSFPLVPFSNRIRDGRFTFRGREIVLRPNMAGDPSPLHARGCLAPWDVENPGRAHAELVFRHTAGEWPWDYEARQHFALDADGLA